MFFLCSILFQIIFIFDVIAAKRKMPNDLASYSNRQNKSVLEGATPFFPDDVTLLARWLHYSVQKV